MKTSGILSKTIKYLAICLIWIVVWTVLALIVNNSVFLPSWQSVLARLAELIVSSKFWITVFASLLRVLLGYLLGIVLGVLFALMGNNEFISGLLSPIKSIIRATPVASFIMLAWVWLTRNNIPSFVGMLMVVPVMWGNISEGVKNFNADYLKFARCYQLNKLKKIKHIYLPQIMPYFTSALFTCSGLVWKAGIAAEVLCQPQTSIGTQLFNAKSTLETVDLFAWTTLIIIISLLLEKAVKVLLSIFNKSLKVTEEK